MPNSPRARKRRTSPRRQSLTKHPLAFPILAALVAGFILLGAFQYTLSVAVGSAIVVGFFVRRWWQSAANPQPRKARPNKAKRKRT